MKALSLRTCTILGVAGLLLAGCRETDRKVPTGPGTPLFGTIGTPNKQDWKQCQNNKNFPDDACTWVTGNLDGSHNIYHEGDFVPHALRIGGVQNTDPFTVVMTYGFLKGGKTSHDFIGQWNLTMHNANPCVDASYSMFCSPGSPGTLTGPFVTSDATGPNSIATRVQGAVNAACGATSQYALDMAHAISAVGGDKLVYTGQNVSSIVVNSIAFDGCPASGDAEATVTLTVTPTDAAKVSGKTDPGLLLLIASHVARTWYSDQVGDWHNGGAFVISGSPYHLGLLTVDGKSAGSMDLQMSAQAVVVLGDLYWEKHAGSATGALLGGATFNVCGPTAGTCVSVTDNSLPDTDPADGKFHMAGLALGTYTITETAAPTGYNLDATAQSVTLSFTLPSNISAPLKFVNYQPTAKISIASTATNGITVPHTFTVTVQKDPEGDGTFVAAAGVTVTLTLTAAGGASLQDVTNACSTGPTDSNGQCTATFTSPTAGTVTGHATASLTIGAVTVPLATDGTGSNSADAVKTYVAGTLKWLKNDQAGQPLAGATFSYCLGAQTGCPTVLDNSAKDADAAAGKFQLTGLVLGTYTICETEAPAGYTKDPNCQQVTLTTGSPEGQATNAFVNLHPSAKISIGTSATNGITVAHTFTVTLMKDVQGNGTFVAANGEHVDVTLTNGGGASFVLDAASSTCDDAGANTDVNGQCTMAFASATAGTVTGHATANLTVGGVSLSVATNGTGNNSADAVKTYVAGTLKWLKNDQAGQPLAGATFSYCLGAQTSCPTVLDNSAKDADAAAGKFQLTGLVLGTYTICETEAPAGYTKDPTCQQVTLTTGSPEGQATNAFVNLHPAAKISIATSATNGITVAHTFTVTLMKDVQGNGTFVAANGEHVDVTLTNGGGASFVLDAASSTCDDAGANTDVNGRCTMAFASATAGTVTGHATANLTVGGVSLSVATDGAGNNSADAVKTYVAGTLKWLKNDQAGQPLAGATFSYCLGAQTSCPTVLDNSAKDADAAAGKFQLTGLVLGTYTICETEAPAGYTKDPNCQQVTLTTTSPTGQATNAFVNTPTTKSGIYPTQTTCQEFAAGTATILSTLNAGLKGNNINNVSPGVFFYYASVIPVSASDQIAVAQSNTKLLNNFSVLQGQAYLYDASCNRLPFTLALSTDGTQVIDGGLSGLTPGAKYYVGIKYDPSAVVGQQVRFGGVVTKLPDPYTFVMTQNGGTGFNSATITLVQKP